MIFYSCHVLLQVRYGIKEKENDVLPCGVPGKALGKSELSFFCYLIYFGWGYVQHFAQKRTVIFV